MTPLEIQLVAGEVELRGEVGAATLPADFPADVDDAPDGHADAAENGGPDRRAVVREGPVEDRQRVVREIDELAILAGTASGRS